MPLQDFEKIAAKCEISIHLFKMLDFENQLRLSQVNENLQTVFDNFIWQETYQTLIIRKNRTHFITSNGRGSNRVQLTARGLQDFLQKYAQHVHELDVDCMPMLDIQQFKNIHCLKYEFSTKLRPSEFEILQSLPRLVSLQFYPKHDDLCAINKDLSLNTLLSLTNLKKFAIYNYNTWRTIKFSNLCQIVGTLNLECLKLSSALEPENIDILESVKPRCLKELHLAINFSPDKWPNHISSLLLIFENLSVLSIRLDDQITEAFLSHLSKACSRLKKLTIGQTSFYNIKSFDIPANLQELTFIRCRCLSRDIINRVVSEYKLKKFISKHTSYLGGTMRNCQVSSSLETFFVDIIDLCEYRWIYDRNEHLKELMWNHNWECSAYDLPLASCVNLEYLIVIGSLLKLETLLRLKHLRKLEIHAIDVPIDWSYLAALLKHPALEELIINKQSNESGDYTRSMWGTAPAEGFPTNVLSLKVHVEKFQQDSDFYLDLFCCNLNMKLEIFGILNEKDILSKLIHHKGFPRTLGTIEAFGYTLNCNDLRRNVDATIEQLMPYSGNKYANRIILSRMHGFKDEEEHETEIYNFYYQDINKAIGICY